MNRNRGLAYLAILNIRRNAVRGLRLTFRALLILTNKASNYQFATNFDQIGSN